MTKVLIVDDAKEARVIGKYLLQQYKVQILEASNGLEAWSLIIKEKPDAILLDLEMPVMDGFQVLEELKYESFQIPVIVITSDNSDYAQQQCKALGAMSFISKPVNTVSFHIAFTNICKLS